MDMMHACQTHPHRDHARGPGRNDQTIAVLIPCKDEAPTIAAVVGAFRALLPAASVWVCDNGSRDDTGRRAADAGANVVVESRPGKGNAVRRLFSCVDADIYLLVDGDGTYDAADAPLLIDELLSRRVEMVVGQRITAADQASAAYRRGHRVGNRAFARLITGLFGVEVMDPFSGYRVFSRRFVRSFPALSAGFEVETELTIHALELGMTICEIPTRYVERPTGSSSKLRTYRDGTRIALALAYIYQQVKPLVFFGVLALALALVSLALGLPLIYEYAQTGYVPRFPTAILATTVMLLAVLCAVCGTILDSVARARREAKRMLFLVSG